MFKPEVPYRRFAGTLLLTAAALSILAIKIDPAAAAPHDPLGEQTASISEADYRTTLRQLKTLRTQISTEEGRLTGIKRNHDEIERSIGDLTAKLASAQTERETLSRDIENIANETLTLESMVDRTKVEVETQHKRLLRRVVAIYKMHHQTTAADFIFKAVSTTDLLKRARMLEKVATNDRYQLEQLNALLKDLERDQSGLITLKSNKESKLQQIGKLEREMEDQQAQKAALLLDAEDRERQQEETVGRLSQSAEKLEALLSKIMGSGVDVTIAPEETHERPGPQATPEVIARVEDPIDQKQDFDRMAFRGGGLSSSVGRLPLPVSGKLIQRFGKHRHDDFSEVLFNKGWEFTSPVGAKASAVAPGKVVFNQLLPGYGNVVILDHGRRYYTLYGRLATSLVQVNQEVNTGDALAVLGENDEKGRNFYFEIRIEGKAIDPSQYFKAKPQAG